MNDSSAQARVPLYPRSVKGTFRRFKNGILILAYVVYYGLPWLPWSRSVGPDRAVLFDIVGRKFYFFGLVVQPQQIFWLAGILLIAALLLFFVTGVAGRVFCGYFCFQTVWTDVFTWLDEKFEGPPLQRRKLDHAPWTWEKIRIKVPKHIIWILIGVLTGISFTLWFGDAPTLWKEYLTLQAPMFAWVTVGTFTFFTYVFAGFMREQVCFWLCPYARLQGMMYDCETSCPPMTIIAASRAAS